MLAASHRTFSSLPTIHHGVMDESGTINPAALNAPGKHFLHLRSALQRGAQTISDVDVQLEQLLRMQIPVLTYDEYMQPPPSPRIYYLNRAHEASSVVARRTATVYMVKRQQEVCGPTLFHHCYSWPLLMFD